MNTPILNRDAKGDFQHPSDGWYQIEAKGNHPNRRAGIVQVVDGESSTAIVNRFNSDAKAGKLRHGDEMLIDHEHFKEQQDKETRAYGWLQELANRDDGIYARIRWTATGKAAVDGGDYRFFSTEYDPEDLEVLNDSKKGARKVRPLRLDGLSLTNMNNNRGQKPITNREKPMEVTFNREMLDYLITNGDFAGHPFHGNQYGEGEDAGESAERHSSNAESASEKADKSGSAEHHGKAAEAHTVAAFHHHAAAEEAKAQGDKKTASYHSKMEKMHGKAAAKHEAQKNAPAAGSQGKTGFPVKNRDNTTNTENMKDIAKLLGLPEDTTKEAVSAEITKIKNRAIALEGEQVDSLLAAHKITDEKALARLKPILNRMETMEEREAFLTECVTLPAPGKPQVKLYNRDGAAPKGQAATDDDASMAAKITNRAAELKTPHRTFDSCWQQAKRELTQRN